MPEIKIERTRPIIKPETFDKLVADTAELLLNVHHSVNSTNVLNYVDDCVDENVERLYHHMVDLILMAQETGWLIHTKLQGRW